MSHDEDEFDKPSEVTFLPSWIDFFVMAVLWLVVSSRAGQGQAKQFRPIGKGEKPVPQVVDPQTTTNIDLLQDGTLRLDGKPTISQDLILSLSTESGKRPILVSIETAANGQGALKALIQLQIDLTQAKLWDRVRVQTRSTDSTNNLTRGKAGREP